MCAKKGLLCALPSSSVLKVWLNSTSSATPQTFSKTMARQDFTFLDQELDVLGLIDHQHRNAVAVGMGLFVHMALHV
jgi:hypothetical protein